MSDEEVYLDETEEIQMFEDGTVEKTETDEGVTTSKKKKSAKEKFAESTGFEMPKDLGLTKKEEPVEEEEKRLAYKAQAVENVPEVVREGMQVFGAGTRRNVGQDKDKKEKKEFRINKNTVKAFPNKELGSVNKTTFKG